MNTIKYRLSDFTKGCDGRWENAIYIPCGQCAHPCHLKQRGCLMTAAPSGEPILLGVIRYEKLTRKKVTPEYCGASISRDVFEAAFSRYLLWELEQAGDCSLRHLEKKTGSD